MADRNDLIIAAVGDVLPWYEGADDQFDEVAPLLKGADIAFGQLEGVFSTRGTRQLGETGLSGPSREPRWVIPSTGNPRLGGKVLSDAGFNIVSFASNHAMTRSEEAMLDTLTVLRENNIAAVGAGKNIEEATRPAILERKDTKVGFLAYCSVVPRGQWATVNGSGVAPMRASTSYEQFDWQPGTPPRTYSKAYPEDLNGMIDDIKKLRPLVDVLVVSQHWGIHFVPAIIPQYEYEVAHAAIDAGADLILGHHPHILKGIEVYKGKVIFHSLANFRMETFPGQLQDELGGRYASILGYRYEVDPKRTNFQFPLNAEKSIMVRCVIKNRQIQRVACLPLWLNMRGCPEPIPRTSPLSDEWLCYVEWLCREEKLATKLSRDGDEVVVL